MQYVVGLLIIARIKSADWLSQSVFQKFSLGACAHWVADKEEIPLPPLRKGGNAIAPVGLLREYNHGFPVYDLLGNVHSPSPSGPLPTVGFGPQVGEGRGEGDVENEKRHLSTGSNADRCRFYICSIGKGVAPGYLPILEPPQVMPLLKEDMFWKGIPTVMLLILLVMPLGICATVLTVDMLPKIAPIM